MWSEKTLPNGMLLKSTDESFDVLVSSIAIGVLILVIFNKIRLFLQYISLF